MITDDRWLYLILFWWCCRWSLLQIKGRNCEKVECGYRACSINVPLPLQLIAGIQSIIYLQILNLSKTKNSTPRCCCLVDGDRLRSLANLVLLLLMEIGRVAPCRLRLRRPTSLKYSLVNPTFNAPHIQCPSRRHRIKRRPPQYSV